MTAFLEQLSAASLEDIEEIAGIFFREAGHPGTFNFPHFKSVWQDFLSRDRGFIFVVRLGTGRVSGLIGAICGPDIYSGEPTTFPQFWYVLPGYRGRNDGGCLFRAMEQEAIVRGSVAILLGHLLSINPDGFKKFFEREDYEIREIIYRKVLK